MKSFRSVKSFLQLLFFNLLVVLGTPAAVGAQAHVDILGLSFDPETVTINVHDDVVWTWQTPLHNTQCDDPEQMWDSGVFDTGYVWTNNFTKAGTYSYYCIVHYFYG